MATENVVDVTYAQTGKSVATDELGMREMQARAYEQRASQYLLIKAPPASGKSRALMFIALDKLFNQGRRKVIVAVPERSIGASFAPTDLTTYGFFADWDVKPANNLCTPGSNESKVAAFLRFLEGPDATLVCTHATLRFAFEQAKPEDFNGCVIAIDEFHHVSADLDNNRLGSVLHAIMEQSDAHIIAMTGSYFRGDSVPVLDPKDEAKFTPVTFNYYDQLNGYQYLKTLGIGHHFYQGRYTDAIAEVLDLDKKTILHIPSVNSGESTKDKYEEVGKILDIIGEVLPPEEVAQVEPRFPGDDCMIFVRRRDTGAVLRVADLVDDSDEKARAKTLVYLTDVAAKNRDAADIIIALGMAKEGFDWPFAEHALTVGYRASHTELIQIIGRVTRDSPGKSHAQFTNLLAEPDATQNEVTLSVNNVLKGITAALLMEQVLAPNYNFRAKRNTDEAPDPGTLEVKGLVEPTTKRAKEIIATGIDDLKANILQDDQVARAAAGAAEPEVINKVLIPRIIRQTYPDITEKEVEQIRQQVVVSSVIKSGEVRTVGDRRFVEMGNKFVDIDEINIDLIESINPFQKAFEVMSKQVSSPVLRIIQDAIAATRITLKPEEAMEMWPAITDWVKVNGRRPDVRSDDPTEKMYAEGLLILQREKAKRDAEKAAAEAAAEAAAGVEPIEPAAVRSGGKHAEDVPVPVRTAGADASQGDKN
ncbi:DEAD/DEAH box helicase [Actinotignum schaalii]|uniref:DEAD/DEAH box helicase n=1 Tax=Actinotignum schaalii TaxID=59505 RepID=UPI00373F5821